MTIHSFIFDRSSFFIGREKPLPEMRSGDFFPNTLHPFKQKASRRRIFFMDFLRLANSLAHPSDGRGRGFYRDAPNSRIAARFFSLVCSVPQNVLMPQS